METPREKIGDFVRMEEITQAKLKESLNYDPDTGNFTWVRENKTGLKGRVGTISEGYLKIKLFGKIYAGHRLAWLYMTGSWPQEDIDHINRDKNDNRWLNLRLSSMKQNSVNRPKQSNNKSGYKGVFWNKHKNAWIASIRAKSIGQFRCKHKAALAYNKEAKKLYGEFAYLNEVPDENTIG